MVCSNFELHATVPESLMKPASYIDYQQKALQRMLAVLVVSIGGIDGGRIVVLPRYMRSKIFHFLRPAESALRRMIIVLAAALEQSGYSAPKRTKRAAPTKPIPKGQRDRIPSFPLIDPRKHFDWFGTKKKRKFAERAPNIIAIGASNWRPEPAPEPKPEPTPDDPIDSARLWMRLLSFKEALEDLPKQAKRMMRLKARNPKRFARKMPMRPGWPPGWRQDKRSEVDEILRDCHWLALRAMADP